MAGEKKFLYLGDDGFLKPSTSAEAVEIAAASLKITLAENGGQGVVHLDANGMVSSSLVVNSDITDGTIATAKIAGEAITAEKLATDSVITAKIQNLAVTEAKLANGAVATAKIADGAVTADKLASGSIETAKIADLAVTTAKLADGAVTTAKINDGAVTTDKIGSAQVTNAKLAADAVATANIVDANVTTAKIADSNVTTAKIADSNVTTAKIADSNVTTAKIADSNVTTDKLDADAVTNAKLADDAVQTENILDGAVTKAKIDSAANVAYLDDNQSFTGENVFTQSVEMAGASMKGAIDMMGDGATKYKIQNLEDGTSYYDAANWGQVQSLVNGIQYKEAAKFFLDVSGSPEPVSIAGLSAFVYDSGSPKSPFAVGDRMLVKGLSDAKTDGLYKFGSSELERPADFSNGQKAAGAFVFCDQKVISGASFSAEALDVAFLCSNTPGSDVIGTNDLTFIKYSGAEALAFTAPLYESADGLEIELKYFKGLTTEVDGGFTKLKVALGDGLELDGSENVKLKLDSDSGLSVSGSGAKISLDGGNSGLSLGAGGIKAVAQAPISIDGSGIKLDLAANGSLEVSADELQVKLSGTTLQSGSGGLEVLGVPSSFTVAGSATNASVSAANLNTLTGAEASYADSLHSHKSTLSEADYVGSLSAGFAVYVSGGSVTKTDVSSASGAKCVGLSVGREGASGKQQFATSGIVTVGSLPGGASAGDALYAKTDGSLGLFSDLSSGQYVIKVGRAISSTEIAIAIQDVGVKV